jgi:hypothetical protein
MAPIVDYSYPSSSESCRSIRSSIKCFERIEILWRDIIRFLPFLLGHLGCWIPRVRSSGGRCIGVCCLLCDDALTLGCSESLHPNLEWKSYVTRLYSTLIYGGSWKAIVCANACWINGRNGSLFVSTICDCHSSVIILSKLLFYRQDSHSNTSVLTSGSCSAGPVWTAM